MEKAIRLVAHIDWDEDDRQKVMRQINELNEQLEKTSVLTDTLVGLIEKININLSVDGN